MNGHPFMAPDEEGPDGVETATELLIVQSGRVTPMTVVLQAGAEHDPERDASMLASVLQTSLPFESFTMLTRLMVYIQNMKAQQLIAAQQAHAQQADEAAEEGGPRPPRRRRSPRPPDDQ